MIMFLQLLLTFSSIPTHASASQLLCSCAPLVYRWTLDFSQVCDFNSIGNSNGIIGADVGEDEAIEFATCGIYTEYPDEELSMIPVSVIRYQIIELGLNMQRLKEFSSTALEDFVPLVHGQDITFDSTLHTVDGEIPKGLIVFVFAVNDKGDQIELQWMIRYSNFCEMYPLHNGDSLGWMVFSDTSTPAFDTTCLLPSMAPSIGPSLTPTNVPSLSYSPSIELTESPSLGPTVRQSFNPSTSPTESPTHTPTKAPAVTKSFNPSTSPQESPTHSPSKAPVTKSPILEVPSIGPSLTPTNVPSLSYSPSIELTESPSLRPTVRQSFNPSTSPTESPTHTPTKAPAVTKSFNLSTSPQESPTHSPSKAPVTKSPIPEVPMVYPTEDGKGGEGSKATSKSSKKKYSKAKSSKGRKSEKSSKPVKKGKYAWSIANKKYDSETALGNVKCKYLIESEDQSGYHLSKDGKLPMVPDTIYHEQVSEIVHIDDFVPPSEFESSRENDGVDVPPPGYIWDYGPGGQDPSYRYKACEEDSEEASPQIESIGILCVVSSALAFSMVVFFILALRSRVKNREKSFQEVSYSKRADSASKNGSNWFQHIGREEATQEEDTMNLAEDIYQYGRSDDSFDEIDNVKNTRLYGFRTRQQSIKSSRKDSLNNIGKETVKE